MTVQHTYLVHGDINAYRHVQSVVEPHYSNDHKESELNCIIVKQHPMPLIQRWKK